MCGSLLGVRWYSPIDSLTQVQLQIKRQSIYNAVACIHITWLSHRDIRTSMWLTFKPCGGYVLLIHGSPPLTDTPTALIPIPASVVIAIWYRPVSLSSVLLTVRLRQLSKKVYFEVLAQERFTAPVLPMNTHWIPSFVTFGTGSFPIEKEMVIGSPMLIGLLVTPSEGDTSGGTIYRKGIIRRLN